jgi:hypothetical protein
MPSPPFADLLEQSPAACLSLQPSASTGPQRLAVLVKIDNHGIDVFQVAPQDLPRATLHACAAHTVSCSRRCIDEVQVGLYVAIGHKKDVSFHVFI